MTYLKRRVGETSRLHARFRGILFRLLYGNMGDTMIKSQENQVINENEQTLLLKNVDEWQSGVYSCFATNHAGVAVSTSKLTILRMYIFCLLLFYACILRCGTGFIVVRSNYFACLLYTSPSPRDKRQSRMPSSA